MGFFLQRIGIRLGHLADLLRERHLLEQLLRFAGRSGEILGCDVALGGGEEQGGGQDAGENLREARAVSYMQLIQVLFQPTMASQMSRQITSLFRGCCLRNCSLA